MTGVQTCALPIWIGANAASAYLAYARGDPLTAAKYGGDVVEASAGTKALRKAHGAVAKAIGEKNYDLAMKGYKGARHGVTLGYNLAHLKHMNDAYNAEQSAMNAAKLGLAGVHVANAADKAHGFMEKLKLEQKQAKAQQQMGNNAMKKPVVGTSMIGKKKPTI